MNVVILCGGLGTRLAEEAKLRPKPMIERGTAHHLAYHEALCIMTRYGIPGKKLRPSITEP